MLERDMSQKKALMDKATASLAASEVKFRELKERQVETIYNPSV